MSVLAPIFGSVKNREAQWSVFYLIRRHLLVFGADRKDVFLFFLQPIVIGILIILVAPLAPSFDASRLPVAPTSSWGKRLFLGNIASLWLACSNAAQVIVRERSVFLRERLAGLRIHKYLVSKFICVSFFALVQTTILFQLIHFGKRVDAGDGMMQYLAMLGGAITMSGVGLLLSAVSSTSTQAVFWVPLLIIPQILLAGFVFNLSLWRERPLPFLLSYVCPSYAAQRITDASLLQNRNFSPEFLDDVEKMSESSVTNIALARVPFTAWFHSWARLLPGNKDAAKPYIIRYSEQQVRRYALTAREYQWPSERPRMGLRIGPPTGIMDLRDLLVHPIWSFTIWYLGAYLLSAAQLSRNDLEAGPGGR